MTRTFVMPQEYMAVKVGKVIDLYNLQWIKIACYDSCILN